jgi:hypothetical protein
MPRRVHFIEGEACGDSPVETVYHKTVSNGSDWDNCDG